MFISLALCHDHLLPLKDKWIKAANSRGVDGKAAFDYYVKTGQEAAAKMKK